MAGINIGADIEARGFIKGVDDMAGALEDLQKEVEDVQKDGDKSLEKLEKSFAEVAKASREAGDDISKSLGKGTKDATKEAEGGLKDLKEESMSTAKESAASFDGSAESIIDSFQEIAANAFIGFGPAGSIAGLALAAGIGIGTAAIMQSEEQAKIAKTRIGELGIAMIDAGADGSVPLQSITENLQNIITNSEDAVKGFKDISQASKTAGTDAAKIAMAYAGNEDAIKGQMGALEDLIEEQQNEVDKAAEHGSRFATVSDAKLKALQLQQTDLKKVQEETQAAADIEQAWLQSGGAEILAKQEAIDGINQAYDDVVGSVTDFIDEETGILDVQKYIDAMTARETALSDYQTALAESGLSTEQKSALNDMGVDAAASWMAGYKSATPEQKETMKRFLTEAAKDSSGAAKDVIDEAFKKPTKAKVEAVADTEEAEKALDALIKNRTAKIQINYVDRYGKKVD